MAKITPNASAKPTVKKADKPKKDKVARKDYFDAMNINKKDPAVYPYAGHEVNGVTLATPEGFDERAHEYLRKTDFSKPSLYMQHRAELYELKAAKFRALADKVRAQGDGKGAGKANRLVKMAEKFAALQAELAGQGIDVAALLANTKPVAKEEAVAEVTA